MSGSRSKEQQQEWQQQKLQQEQQPGQQLAHLAARLGCVAAAALFVLAESVPGLECPWSSRASAAEADYEPFNSPLRRANAGSRRTKVIIKSSRSNRYDVHICFVLFLCGAESGVSKLPARAADSLNRESLNREGHCTRRQMDPNPTSSTSRACVASLITP